MPPFVALAGALGSAAVVRWAYRTAKRINQELDDARARRVAEQAPATDLPTLRRDPVSGAYRPGKKNNLQNDLRRPGRGHPPRAGVQAETNLEVLFR